MFGFGLKKTEDDATSTASYDSHRRNYSNKEDNGSNSSRNHHKETHHHHHRHHHHERHEQSPTVSPDSEEWLNHHKDDRKLHRQESSQKRKEPIRHGSAHKREELTRNGHSRGSKEDVKHERLSTDPCFEPTDSRYIYEQHRHADKAVSIEVQLALAKLVEELKVGNRELKEMHGLLKEKMEDASAYIITLEERLGHFNNHLRKTDEELGQLKGKLEDIEKFALLFAPSCDEGSDELFEGIEDWKGAFCKVVHRQKERRQDIISRTRGATGPTPGSYPEVRIDKVE